MDISIDKFADVILEELENYSEEVEEATKKEIQKVTKEVKKEVKVSGSYVDKTGLYRKAISIKHVAEGNGYKRNKVYVKSPHYRLTHLLEKGHLNNNGTGRTKAYPHWQKGQDIADRLPQRIKEGIEKIK